AAAARELPLWRLPHHTIRRVAAGVIAELCRWPKAVESLWRLGFFSRLPPLLRDLAVRYRYGQTHYKMYGRGQRTDQGQYIFERLVTACVSPGTSMIIWRYCAQSLMESLVRFYPRMNLRRSRPVARRWLRPRPEDDTRPASGDTGTCMSSSDSESELTDGGGGGGCSRPPKTGRRAVNCEAGAEVPQLEFPLDGPPPRGKAEDERPNMLAEILAEEEGRSAGPGMWDPMATAFLRFVAAVWGQLSSAQQERYVANGLLSALIAFPIDPSYNGLFDMRMMFDMRMIHNRISRTSFATVRAADASLRDRANRLKLRGNAAFKAGAYEAALVLYTQAVAMDWDEPTLRNNRCFTLLKLGRLGEARTEGGYSVQCEPRNARSWSRLAAVYQAIEYWQAAQLCYRQALSLMAPRTDDELTTRLQEVEGRLRGVKPWRFETLPPHNACMDRGKWRTWISMHLPRAQVRALDEFSAAAGMGVPGTAKSSAIENPVLSAAIDSEPYEVSAKLTHYWDVACALEEAPKAPKNARLQFNTSWTDTGMRDRDTGLVLFTVTCMSCNHRLAITRVSPGKPRFPALRNAFCNAIARPFVGKPSRPRSILLAHRAVPYYEQLKVLFDSMDVEIVCESIHEATQSAANFNTDPLGYNHRDQYFDHRRSAEELKLAPGATRPSDPPIPPPDILSDDDTSTPYRVMLAGAIAGGGRDGDGTGGGSGGSGVVAVPAMPSDDQVRAAMADLLLSCDPASTTVRDLRLCLNEKFGTDVACKNGIIRQMAAKAGVRD
ncbi:hypothetical protein Vretifemale_1085, partial [Volvox reticuliferus]